MDSRVASVWRLTWPKSIPEHEYETAAMMAALIQTTGRKPERPAAESPPPLPAALASGEGTLSVSEAAALLGVPISRIYGWIRDGRVTTHRTGHRIALMREEISQMSAALGSVSEPPRLAVVQSPEASAELLDAKAVAAELGLTVGGVLYNANIGRLKGVKRDGRFYFARADLDAYLRARPPGSVKRGRGRKSKHAVKSEAVSADEAKRKAAE